MKFTSIVGFTATLLVVSVAYAASATPFPALVDGFVMDLPPGWVQIPAEAVEQAEKEVARRAPNARHPHSDYALQFGNRGQWFTYPYVLIHVDRQGRIPEPELAKADNFSSNAATAKATDALQNIASELDIGKMRYDPATHVLWVNTGSNVTGIGRVLGTSAIVPTQHGHIDVSGYSLERDFVGFVSVFHDLVNSITPEPSMKYQTSLLDHLPFLRGFKWESLLTSALLGGVMAAVGGLAWRRKK